MAAMMLPSLAPVLGRYRQSVWRTRETCRGRLTTLAGLGYFFVWTLLGLAVFPVGVAMATIEMEQPVVARAVPIAVGLVVLIAGALQFTKWKAHHLTCGREARATSMPRVPLIAVNRSMSGQRAMSCSTSFMLAGLSST